MEPEVRFTFIGAILLALLLAASATLVWLTRAGPNHGFRYYTIYFERQSLQGLQVASEVQMRGVQVGRVERFAIARDNINRVQVTIRVDAGTPVSTNTVGVVGRALLTGLAWIDLVTPGIPGPELVEVRENERFPVITEGQSDLEHVVDAVNRMADTGASVLAKLDTFLDQENRAAVIDTLASLRGMAEAIRTAAVTAEKAGASTDTAAKQATATLREVARAAATLERAAETASVDLRATAQELRTTAEKIGRAAETGSVELRATVQEFRSSAEKVERAADRLDDPRAVIFGPSAAQLGPGEKLR